MGTKLPLPRQGCTSPQFSAHVSCSQTAGCNKMLLGAEVGLGLPSKKERGQFAQQPHLFFSYPLLLWPNGRLSQLLLSSCTNCRRKCRTFLCERVIIAWNNLPADINFSAMSTFKRTINCVDFLVFFDGIFRSLCCTVLMLLCLFLRQ